MRMVGREEGVEKVRAEEDGGRDGKVRAGVKGWGFPRVSEKTLSKTWARNLKTKKSGQALQRCT